MYTFINGFFANVTLNDSFAGWITHDTVSTLHDKWNSVSMTKAYSNLGTYIFPSTLSKRNN